MVRMPHWLPIAMLTKAATSSPNRAAPGRRTT